MTTPFTPGAWTASIVATLTDTIQCPRCFTPLPTSAVCGRCRADLRGENASRVWAASTAAVDALRARDEVLATVTLATSEVPLAPVRAGAVSASMAVPAVTAHQATTPGGTPPGHAPAAAPDLGVSPPPASASLQSVLAVAGAGLFAVAAVVFAFFNPELTAPAARLSILGGIAVAFLVGAWMLSRRALLFSAEAVGALGMVFLALTISAMSALATTGGGWTTAAIGTLVAGAAMAALAWRVGLRSWSMLSLVGLAFVPAMFAGGVDHHAAAFGGFILTGFAACGLIWLITRVRARFDGAVFAERAVLTGVQLLAIPSALIGAFTGSAFEDTNLFGFLAVGGTALCALSLLSTRHLLGPLWTVLAGIAFSAAALAATMTLPIQADAWMLTALTATAALCAIAAVLLARWARLAPASVMGAMITAALPSAAAMLSVLILAEHTIQRATFGAVLSDPLHPAPIIVASAILAVAAAVLAGVTRRSHAGPAVLARPVAAGLTIVTALSLACLPTLAPLGASLVALGVAIASVALTRLRPVRRLGMPTIVVLSCGAHLAVLFGAILSWGSAALGASLGLVVIAAITAAATTLPRGARFLHAAAGYAYGLVIFAVALDLAGLDDVARLCLTSVLGSLGAVAATFLRRLSNPAWISILTVTAVPYVLGVIQVYFERSPWTGLATASMFALTLTLLLIRVRPIAAVVRGIAAALLVPTLAVMVVCLSAQLPASGSPVALPIIAVIVALTVATSRQITSALARHGLGADTARFSALAVEASALLTGLLTVGLALWRTAAGLPTATLTLLILAVGAAGAAIWSKRTYGWWLAAACTTGALWCVWALMGLRDVEPYLLPPALGAAVVALILTALRRPNPGIFGVGLALAIVPLLVVLAVAGNPPGATAAWRAFGLLAGGVVLAVFSLWLGSRPTGRFQSLLRPSLALSTISATAAVIQAARWGLGFDGLAFPLTTACLIVAAVGAAISFIAARVARATAAPESRLAHTRWLYAVPLAVGTFALWPAIHRDWVAIWTMWAAMLALLAVVVITSVRLRRGHTALPPVAFTFALAFITAIVAWSPRDLRVEWFSLPLGLALLAAGVVHLRRQDDLPATLSDWPRGASHSWALLGPGLIVTVLASIIATFTDPMTWRAILVIVIALAAILWGAKAHLRAPFIFGVIVLPIENVFVFAVQFGRGIESMPWWITLAVVGAVLLIISVTYERRESGGSSITARLRDLR